MRYYLRYIGTSGIVEVEVQPQHIRDAHVGETLMLETFLPEISDGKMFSKIGQIIIEKGKRIYDLTIDYRQNLK